MVPATRGRSNQAMPSVSPELKHQRMPPAGAHSLQAPSPKRVSWQGRPKSASGARQGARRIAGAAKRPSRTRPDSARLPATWRAGLAAVTERAAEAAERDAMVLAVEREQRREARVRALDRPLGSVAPVGLQGLRAEAALDRLGRLQATLRVVEDMRQALASARSELLPQDRVIVRLLLRVVRRGVSWSAQTAADFEEALAAELAADDEASVVPLEENLRSLEPVLEVLRASVG